MKLFHTRLLAPVRLLQHAVLASRYWMTDWQTDPRPPGEYVGASPTYRPPLIAADFAQV